MEQRSEEWFTARAGKFTASRSSDLMARLRNGQPGAGYGNLIATLAVERLTGQCVETFQNDAMRRGQELEPVALEAYVFETCEDVEQIGFVVMDDLPNTGCSPDGLVGADGLVEVKCPAAMAKHLDYLRAGSHADEYAWQLQHQLMVTGRLWVDCVSFDPRYPAGLQLAIRRVGRNQKMIDDLTETIIKADAEISCIVAELKDRKKLQAAE